MRAWILAIAALMAASTWSCRTGGVQARSFELPGVVLWAWERPEDLRFLDPERAGVAFLAATASILPDGNVWFHPRTQRLALPRGAAVLAVVRIEPALRHARIQAQALLRGLAGIASLPDVRGLQIDFDARRSERGFYRSLLESIPSQMHKPVGITALASWCVGDRWLDREPIVEAVPMFFRMSRSESHDMTVESAICRSSIGLSMDEPWPVKRPASLHRIYLFSPRAWTQAEYAAGLERLKRWK
jgi:hypothetical protein